MTAAFTLQNVSLAPSRLSDLSLEIGRGETTAVLGASGAGKSSLLAMLAGFLKSTSGDLKCHESVSWVPQDGGLWAGLTVREHLEAVATERAAIARMIDLFDLDGLERRTPEKLSRGQQARLAIARALVSDAKALVMDEPLAHVATEQQSAYSTVIRDAVQSSNRTLVFATHDPGFALAEAQMSLCLKEGRLLCHERTDNLYWRADTREKALFLGPTNWLPEEVSATWGLTGRGRPSRSNVRPEELSITQALSAQSNSARVVESRFFGTHEAVQLELPTLGEKRTFFHRPRRPSLAPGDAVSVEFV